VKDIAAIHVAATLDPTVTNARIQSWGHPTHWNEVLAVLRELRPTRDFVDDYPETYHIKVSVDQSEALALLRKWTGRNDWIARRQSIVENVNTPFLED
jgi:hypothetical protein